MLAAVLVVLVALDAAGGGRNVRRAVTAAGARPHPTPTRQSPPRRAVGTPGATAATVTDRIRRTILTLHEPANASIATAHSQTGEPIRVLSTVVRYPETSGANAVNTGSVGNSPTGRFPLVVFSQGYDIAAEAYSALLTAWARAGYVVADPTYPLTDPSAPSGVNEADILNHPADLRFVISSLLAAGRNPHSPLYGLLDPHEVGIIGHSDGGDVSLAVAANSCCRDPSIKAAVILSGAELSAFGGRYYASGSVPLLVVQGSADIVNIPGCSAQLYDEAPAPKYYLDIPGAEHEPPYLDPAPARSGVARAVISFLDAYLKDQPARLTSLVRAGRMPAGETITSTPVRAGAGTYCPGAP